MLCIYFRDEGGQERQLEIGFPSRNKEEQGVEITAQEGRNLPNYLKGEVPGVTCC